jgi:hypothetical protein
VQACAALPSLQCAFKIAGATQSGAKHLGDGCYYVFDAMQQAANAGVTLLTCLGVFVAQPSWDLPAVDVHNSDGFCKTPPPQGSQGIFEPCVCSLLPPTAMRTSCFELYSTQSQGWAGCHQIGHLVGAAFDAGAAARGSRALSIGEVDLRQPLPLIERYGSEGPMLGTVRSMSADATTGTVAKPAAIAEDGQAQHCCSLGEQCLLVQTGQEQHGMFFLEREADVWLCCVLQALLGGLAGERRGVARDCQVAWAARPATILPPCSAAAP